MRPVACLITDRTRLRDATPEGVIAQVRAATAAGVHLVQIRERDLEGRALVELTRRVVEAVRGTPTRVLVNDRVDVALAAGAHGVHLRATSFPAVRVRSMVPAGFLVGRSVHHASEIRVAGTGADYLLFGHVFDSQSKPGVPARGVSELMDVARSTTLPVIAVGGVTADRIPALIQAGAAGYAAISMFT